MRLKCEFCLAELWLLLFSCCDNAVHFTDTSAPAVTNPVHLFATSASEYAVMVQSALSINRDVISVSFILCVEC